MLKRQRTRRGASITSLIDVIFLLLLFFMLSSTFSHFSAVELAEAEGGVVAVLEDIEALVLIVGPATVIIDGTTVRDEEIFAMIADVSATMILVTPQEEATTQRLINVLSILKDLSGKSVRVVEEL